MENFIVVAERQMIPCCILSMAPAGACVGDTGEYILVPTPGGRKIPTSSNSLRRPNRMKSVPGLPRTESERGSHSSRPVIREWYGSSLTGTV